MAIDVGLNGICGVVMNEMSSAPSSRASHKDPSPQLQYVAQLQVSAIAAIT